MAVETLKEAVVRELREETHLEVEVLALAEVLDRIFQGPDGRVAYHYVLVDFLCDPKGGELKPDSDAEDARFVPLQELSSYSIPPLTLEIIRRLTGCGTIQNSAIPPLALAVTMVESSIPGGERQGRSGRFGFAL